jgi:hypothetical protein
VLQVKILIGPEDIGKTVVVIPLKKLGIVTSFTAYCVDVRLLNARAPQRFKREEVKYHQASLRF